MGRETDVPKNEQRMKKQSYPVCGKCGNRHRQTGNHTDCAVYTFAEEVEAELIRKFFADQQTIKQAA